MPLGYGGADVYNASMPANGGAPAAASGPTSGWSDPHLQQGAEFYPVDLGNGNVIALCSACYQAAKASILADAGGGGGVNWNSVNWNSVNWNSVNWNSVNWNSAVFAGVSWNPVNWNS